MLAKTGIILFKKIILSNLRVGISDEETQGL
jgi:hypothetical protein